mmetsp:Transcript_3685/g.4091  ORF Transcript_3685/g.4091 Transcript_3685/m.4091 type:complete len:80 (+) Transcript_3685:18-257(+)|eukprot:CAMPEP_0194131284 /NCGR_PEP_ID=MMETSP0152-20130528/2090_1 /TAXON_ID=1049557 /ORGANISM="Thalassiothrix antarctica, Strain L6-D1" /LENGTH=79 /DNA_ID=CAMNT_0038826019 /DNA_START=13 /DNA_END=252 /DNA_ORIENTATION=-
MVRVSRVITLIGSSIFFATTTTITKTTFASAFLLPSATPKNRIMSSSSSIIHKAQAADICPEVSLDSQPTTEIILVALG